MKNIELFNKKLYKYEKECDSCGKKSKLVMPIDYLLRFQDKERKKIKNKYNYNNICWSCVNELV